MGSAAFQGKTALTSVTTGNCVSNISSYAFKGLKDITVKFGEKVNKIHSWAFEDCENLKLEFHCQSIPRIYNVDGLIEVVLGDKVHNVVERAFENCKGLTTITFGNGLISIDKNAFSGCKALQKIIVKDIAAWCNAIHNNIWESDVLLYCNENTVYENVNIPENTTYINNLCFRGIKGIKTVIIPNTVLSIGELAFYGCSDLISVVISNSVTSIGSHAFENCYTLKNVSIGSNVSNIGSCAFFGCISLPSITIPNSVTTIEDYAFLNTMLESVTIGSSVKFLGKDVFFNRDSYGRAPRKVIWLTNTPPTNYENASNSRNYVSNDLYSNFFYNKTIYPFLSSMFEVDGVKYVPTNPSERTCDAIDCVYNETAEEVKLGKTVSYKGIDLTVLNVKQDICRGNPFVKTVDLSFDGTLSDNAFHDCSNLTKAFVSNVKNLGNNAFQGCSKMMTIILGEGITSIGQYAFYGCEKLQSVIIPNTVMSINSYAFSGCTSMTSAKIGTGVTTINQNVFEGCTSLIDVQIGSNVTTIGSSAFSNCSALSNIKIPQSVIRISSEAFNKCKSLKEVILSDRSFDDIVLDLGNGIFADCPLDSIYIGRNITYSTSSNDGYSPFYRNTSLRSVTITDKETEISPNEFYGCTNLKNVRIGDGVTTIGDWAFSGCSSLDYFTFGSSVKTIGKEAFSDCTALTKLISRAATPPTCGSQALDDINKWNCTLSVPIGAKASYQQANQWKDFFFINDDVTSISKLTNNIASPNYIYDLNGRRLNEPSKGINIIRMKDGTTKKVILK